MLDYKKEIPAMTDLLALYSSVGWHLQILPTTHAMLSETSCQS